MKFRICDAPGGLVVVVDRYGVFHLESEMSIGHLSEINSAEVLELSPCMLC